MTRRLLAALSGLTLLYAAPVVAQKDPLYGGRHCNKHLMDQRMPTLAEIGDSARFAALLEAAADSHARYTDVSLHYDKAGTLETVDASGTRSKAALDQLRREARQLVLLQQVPKGPLGVSILRYNRSGRMRVVATSWSTSSITCPPEMIETPRLRVELDEARYDAQKSNVLNIRREIRVMFLLEADGEVSDAWIEVPTGSTNIDSVALHLFRTMRFRPAIIGTSPVAAFVRMPFQF